MYAAINREDMSFLWVNESYNDLANLAWIESVNDCTCIVPAAEVDGYMVFTHMELKTLYRNTTGTEAPYKLDYELQVALSQIAAEFKPVTTISEELEIQACSVVRGDGKKRRYVRFAKVPQIVESDYVPAMLTGAANPLTIQEGIQAHLKAKHNYETAYKARQQVLAEQRVNEPVKPKTTSTHKTKPGAAPKGGITKAVWDYADELWEAAGKATDINTVKELRATLVSKLVSDGFSKSTVGVQYGKWKKSRIIV